MMEQMIDLKGIHLKSNLPGTIVTQNGEGDQLFDKNHKNKTSPLAIDTIFRARHDIIKQ